MKEIQATSQWVSVPNLRRPLQDTPLLDLIASMYVGLNDVDIYDTNSTPIFRFAAGSHISTDKGEIPVENLRFSDLVKTENHGF